MKLLGFIILIFTFSECILQRRQSEKVFISNLLMQYGERVGLVMRFSMLLMLMTRFIEEESKYGLEVLFGGIEGLGFGRFLEVWLEFGFLVFYIYFVVCQVGVWFFELFRVREFFYLKLRLVQVYILVFVFLIFFGEFIVQGRIGEGK